ncbi:MAG: ROK family protein [Bacteroidaceae bacterium]|nr:ROK family protein [Bacteroidaceae bacterium]
MAQKTYLGIDLGGTKLLIGEVDEAGHILRRKYYPSGFLNQQEARALIFRSMDDYLATTAEAGCMPQAIGAGLLGRVDAEQGVWEQIDPRRTCHMPLSEELSARYGLPAFIDNDVKSATRAELRWGVGRFSRDFVYINVGTGIAAGIVIGGRLLRGSHCNAGEVGHTTIDLRVGTQCACGRHDCVETIAAGMGFDLCARLLQPQYPTSLAIPAEGRVAVQDVFRLCREGDPLCVRLVANAAEALSGLVMNLVRMSDPDTIVLGGSVVADGYLLSQMQPLLQDETIRFVTHGVQLTAMDARDAGLLGAACVAMDGNA